MLNASASFHKTTSPVLAVRGILIQFFSFLTLILIPQLCVTADKLIQYRYIIYTGIDIRTTLLPICIRLAIFKTTWQYQWIPISSFELPVFVFFPQIVCYRFTAVPWSWQFRDWDARNGRLQAPLLPDSDRSVVWVSASVDEMKTEAIILLSIINHCQKNADYNIHFHSETSLLNAPYACIIYFL